MFLRPTDALHGDIGIMKADDILVLMSKSGNSEELITLIPYALAKGVRLIGVTSNGTSEIATRSHYHVFLPLERELCPFDLAPVTSTAIQMLFGDTCAVAIMLGKGLTKVDYAKNHPAGRIGKRLILRIEDLMKKFEDLPLCSPDDTLMNALPALNEKGFGCILVVNECRELLGTFTDGDLRRSLARHGGGLFSMTMNSLVSYDCFSFHKTAEILSRLR